MSVADGSNDTLDRLSGHERTSGVVHQYDACFVGQIIEPVRHRFRSGPSAD
jgi:hypothetical protein